MRFNVLKQFISLFYGDNGLRPDSFTETDKIKWESVDQILNGAKEDIPFWDTNLFSAGESRNPLINVVHKIIVKQQAARDSRIRGFYARMQEEEAEGQLLAQMLKGENPLGNSRNRNIFTINRDEYTDEFRRIQKESLGLSEKDIRRYHKGFHRGSNGEIIQEFGTEDRKRLGAIYGRLLSGSRNAGKTKWVSLISKKHGTSFNFAQVNGYLFHDVFQINRNYLQNGELVDLHDNYDDCECYLSDDGLCGFAVEPVGNLVSEIPLLLTYRSLDFVFINIKKFSLIDPVEPALSFGYSFRYVESQR